MKNRDEIVTPELKAKIIELFEQSDRIAEEREDLIDELHRRLAIAENVCYAAQMYVKHSNSLAAVGWDMMVDALGEWRREKEKGEKHEI